jgi:lipoprotein-releasing system ATP-binding protein
MNDVIAAAGLVKDYPSGDQTLHILRGAALAVKAGETVAVVGESGVGKTTLLNLLGGLDRPTAGSVHVAGTDIFALSNAARARFRSRRVGYVFQFHHLLPEFNAVENVMLPLLIAGTPAAEAANQARKYLAAVNVVGRDHHRPAGNLDEKTADELHDLLFRLNAESGQTFVVVTHNRAFAARCARTLVLEHGVLTVA